MFKTNKSTTIISVGGGSNSSSAVATAEKLATARTFTFTGGATGSGSFDGSDDVTIPLVIQNIGVAGGLVPLNSSAQIDSTYLPSYVDDVLEYATVSAFPSTGETGKIYVETTDNTTYRWSGSAYIKITSGEVSSVNGYKGVVILAKSDIGLGNVDNTADADKSVAKAAKLTTARTIALTGDATASGTFDGSDSLSLPVTLAASGATAGTYGSSSNTAGTAPVIPTLSINVKGLVTSAGSVTLGTAASYAVGTSGATVPLLSGANTWSSTNTFSALAATGGTIDGTTVGATTASTGKFTTLGATGAATFATTVAVTGATTLTGALAANGGITTTTLTGTGIVKSSATTAATSTTTGAVISAGGLGVAGAAYIGTTFNVAGASTLTGAVTASSTLAVTGASTLTGALTANGGTSTTTLAASGAATLSSTLAVTGASTFNAAINAKVGITNTVYSTTAPALLIANGAVQVLTLAANGTLTCDIATGQSMTVQVPATSYTLALTNFTIANGFTAISSSTLNTLVLVNVAGTLYLYGTNGG